MTTGEFTRRALLRNGAAIGALGAAARGLVESRYGWPEVTNVLENVLLQVSRA